MRGTVAKIATLGILAGCGLARSGLLETGGDGGLTDAFTTDPPPLDSGVEGSSPQDGSPSGDAGGANPDATSGTDAATDAADAGGPPDSSCPAPLPDASVNTATMLAPAPTIDGNLADWGCGPWTELNDKNAAYVLETGQKISGQFAVRWDSKNLYVAARILVPTLSGTNTTAPYDNDAIEIYVTGDSTLTGDYDPQTHQYVVDWHNTAVDYGPVSQNPAGPANTNPQHFTSQVKVMASGWQVEAAIGWQVLKTGPAPTSGATIGLDIAFDDGDGTTLKTQLLAMLPPHAIPPQCTCTSCCCGDVSPTPDMPNCDTLCFGGVTLE